jgi:hypothetical protein
VDARHARQLAAGAELLAAAAAARSAPGAWLLTAFSVLVSSFRMVSVPSIQAVTAELLVIASGEQLLKEAATDNIML